MSTIDGKGVAMAFRRFHVPLFFIVIAISSIAAPTVAYIAPDRKVWFVPLPCPKDRFHDYVSDYRRAHLRTRHYYGLEVDGFESRAFNAGGPRGRYELCITLRKQRRPRTDVFTYVIRVGEERERITIHEHPPRPPGTIKAVE